MTTEGAVFDATACWEVAHGTRTGAKLKAGYIDTGVRVHVSTLAIAELAAKAGPHAADVVNAVKGFAIAAPLTVEVAEAAGGLRGALRKIDPDASLADAIHLATARALGLKLVSNDKAFARERDVEWP